MAGWTAALPPTCTTGSIRGLSVKCPWNCDDKQLNRKKRGLSNSEGV